MLAGMGNIAIARIRTYIPIGIGIIAGFLADAGFIVSDDVRTSVIVAVTGVAVAAYWELARWLDGKLGGVFGFLGIKATPDYSGDDGGV